MQDNYFSTIFYESVRKVYWSINYNAINQKRRDCKKDQKQQIWLPTGGPRVAQIWLCPLEKCLDPPLVPPAHELVNYIN